MASITLSHRRLFLQSTLLQVPALRLSFHQLEDLQLRLIGAVEVCNANDSLHRPGIESEGRGVDLPWLFTSPTFFVNLPLFSISPTFFYLPWLSTSPTSTLSSFRSNFTTSTFPYFAPTNNGEEPWENLFAKPISSKEKIYLNCPGIDQDPWLSKKQYYSLSHSKSERSPLGD